MNGYNGCGGKVADRGDEGTVVGTVSGQEAYIAMRSLDEIMKKKSRRTLSWVLCLGMVGLLLSGCSQTDENRVDESELPESSQVSSVFSNSQSMSKDTVIAVSLPSAEEGWYYDATLLASQYLSQISTDSLGYVLLTASTAQEQSGQLDDLVGQNVHAAVVCPVDASLSAQGAANLKNSGVPLIVFNGSLDGVTADVTVSMDEGQLGKDAAQGLENAGCAGMDVLVFSDESQEADISRTQSFENALSDEISVVYGGSAYGGSAAARQALLDWIDGKDLDTRESVGAIFVSNEEAMLGILEGLSSYESAYGTVFPNLKIIAGCGSSEELQSLISENTEIPVTIWYYSPQAINTAIDLAVDMIGGQTVEDRVSVDGESFGNMSQ